MAILQHVLTVCVPFPTVACRAFAWELVCSLDLMSFEDMTILNISVFLHAAIRRARLAHKKGQLSDADYEKEVNEYMTYAIKEQERIGVDVLVHGEPERSDM